MHVICTENVCEALDAGVTLIKSVGRAESSRNGPVLVAPGPVVTMTRQPRQRVLFSARRDANPFFHAMEPIWMLAGRNDSKFLDRYVKDFGKRFAEPGGVIHGAYGHRWRHAFDFDQLGAVVQRLRESPGDRQCVIQMWDARDMDDGEHPVVYGDLTGNWKDRPCNTHVYVRLRDVAYRDPTVTDQNSAEHEARIVRGENFVLDLTVCCRSNDLIWGAHGANAVHFSVLQEYLAARVGARVGVLYQWSNNYHAYVSELERLERRAGEWLDDRYVSGEVSTPLLMFPVPSEIDEDVRRFCAWHDKETHDRETFANPWFAYTALPMARSMMYYRADEINLALKMAHDIGCMAWRVACVEWLQRRS